jgi:hypothetical protein
MAPITCFNIGLLSYTASSFDDACSIITGNTYYSDYPILTVNAKLYDNTGCTSVAAVGYYSNVANGGNSCYYVGVSGIVQTVNTCYTTPTPTPTITPTITPTQPFAVQFQSCEDGSDIFRFRGSTIPTSVGTTYYIGGSKEFTGCATIVPYSGTGLLYDSDGVTFTSVFDCADGLCPRTNIVSAVLSKCSDGSINYFTVDYDTAFVGGSYLYNNECYSFVRFEGPGGYYLGSPSFKSCDSCLPSPTPTQTPYPTPSITPTITSTPSTCAYTDFCFRTTSSLSGYSGNYVSTGLNYNSRLYYSGDGLTYGVIFHTGDFWCLSDSLGGTPFLSGKIPSYSSCPDLSPNSFTYGPCPTPTPIPVDCNLLDFNAYFDCEYTPPVTPTPTIPCDDVDFVFTTTPGVPVPTSSPVYIVGVNFDIVQMSPTPTPSITPTITPTPTNRIQIGGTVNFNFIDEQFSNSITQVIVDCENGNEYYVSNQLNSGTTKYNIGTILSISITTPNGLEYLCVTYDRDITNISPNSNINQIYGVYGDCTTCQIKVSDTPTPTPTPTPSVTPTFTPTPSITPSPTPVPLIISFNDIINADTLVGNSADVNDWNTYFDLPTNGTPFTSVIVNGNDVNLFGGGGITTKDGLFSDDPNVLKVYDYAGCIEVLGNELFGGVNETSGIQEVYFPEAIESVYDSGYGVFETCYSLTYAYLPKLVTIGVATFSNCSNLSSTQLTLPNELITVLPDGVFFNCVLLNEINFPNLLTIGDNCFSYCEGVTTVNLPLVTSMGALCLSGCIFISELNLPNLTFADNDCFSFCTNLITVNMPSLSYAGDNCFSTCGNILNVYFYELTFAGQNCFGICNSVEIFYFPKLTDVSDECFDRCDSAISFYLPSVTDLGGTVGDDGVFNLITGNTIYLVVPSALMTCNSGNPDGDIQYLQSNNSVTILN